jgi:outer membrane protein OmpA-like peptidoglycan-associated protein
LASKVRRGGSDGQTMQFSRSFLATLLLSAALAAPAAAQSYPGDDVSVNPGAAGRGYLLYPGGRYGRYLPRLLQPGEKPHQVIHLHMPIHHSHVASTTPKPVAALAAPDTTAPAPPIHKAPKPVKQAAVTTDTTALPEDSAARLVGANPAGVPAKPAKPAPPVASMAPSQSGGATTVPFSFGGPSAPVAAPPTRTASATPPARTPPSVGASAGLRKQSMVPFASGASSPAAGDVSAIHSLAASLSAALASGSGRVQLDAYGGPRGDKSSESRRLSLKRALVVRELLIEDGIPSEKIDVRAMGGADDSGEADRVDVFLRG